jgi:hypothetical protein
VKLKALTAKGATRLKDLVRTAFAPAQQATEEDLMRAQALLQKAALITGDQTFAAEARALPAYAPGER